MAASTYQRLTGRARTLAGYSQLWMAPDHLLVVRSTRFHEHYQRFAFSDIQAIIITEQPSRLALQAALGIVAVLWAVCSLTVDLAFFKWFFIVTGAIGLLLVLIDVARGPRCRCYLHTAVSRELLPPVSRMRIARAFLEKLQPAIEAVQGAIPAERFAAIDERSSLHASNPSTPPEIVTAPGYIPEITFGLMLLNAAVILINLYVPNQQLAGLLITTLFTELVLIVVSLFRRAGRDPRRFLYVVMVLALVGIGWDVFYFVRVIVGWFGAAVEAGKHNQQAPQPVVDALFDHSRGLFSAMWRAGAGAVGLLAAYLERRALSPAPVSAAPPQPVTIETPVELTTEPPAETHREIQ